MDSSQFALLGYQQFQERSEQAFAPDAGIMHELKKAQVERQFFLRDAPMRSQPRAQQRPEALGSIDMNLIEAVPVFIAGIFASAMTYGMVIKSPLRMS